MMSLAKEKEKQRKKNTDIHRLKSGDILAISVVL
jgi:hypothetical protein